MGRSLHPTTSILNNIVVASGALQSGNLDSRIIQVYYLFALILKNSNLVYKKWEKNDRLKKTVAKNIRPAVFLFILAGCSSLLLADLETFGYYENRFFVLSSGTLNLQEISENFSLGDYNRLRLQFKSSVSKNISINLALDFLTFHGIIKGPLGVYESPGQSDSTHTDLDRAYIDFYFPGFDMTIGKQRVAIGVSHLWAPLDLFNRVNIFEPKEEKPGVNAFKIYVPVGETSSLTGVFSPEEDFKSSKSGFRAQTLLKGVDIGLSLIHYGMKNQMIYGIDLRGENIIGWWLEGGYFSSAAENNIKIVLGFDYTFPYKRGIYWLNEFFYDESGEKDSARYDYDKLLTGDRFTLGQKYYFSSLQFPFTHFLAGSVSYIGNWTDGSYILSPGLRYELTQNVALNLGLFFLMGKKGGEFNREGANDIFFIWLKMNF